MTHYKNSDGLIFLLILLILVILMFSVIVLLFLNLRTQRKRHIYDLELERSRISTEQFQDYQQRYTVLQNQRHDMKHHIRYMKELMKRKEYSKLQEYIDTLIKEL